MKITKIACLTIKSYQNHNKYLEVIVIRCTQKKLINLRKVVIMIRDYKHLIKLQHIHLEQMLCVSEMMIVRELFVRDYDCLFYDKIKI